LTKKEVTRNWKIAFLGELASERGFVPVIRQIMRWWWWWWWWCTVLVV